MQRISTHMTNNDMQYWARRREFELNSLQNQMGAQSRIKDLRDDPVAAAHGSRYDSFITRLKRFAENVEYSESNHRITEGHLRASVDILHRIRELAVQGAHGTYDKEQVQYMGAEVNQLLEQLLLAANAVNGDGNLVFGADKSKQPPFRAVMGAVPGADGQVVTGVEYVGGIKENTVEVSDGAYMRLNYAGNRVFWAENQQLYGDRDAQAFQVQAETTIYVDGIGVNLRAGDNVFAVIERINNSEAAVRARLDPITNGLVLETTTPHQLWLQDAPGGTVLTDLGFIRDPVSPPPGNLSPTLRVFGGSVFDMIIQLRDTLMRGDHVEVGGRGIRGIDNAMSSLLGALGDLGAQGARLEITKERLAREIPDMTEMMSNELDLDMTEAALNLRRLEFTHRAALGTAGRILMPSLLDFLR